MNVFYCVVDERVDEIIYFSTSLKSAYEYMNCYLQTMNSFRRIQTHNFSLFKGCLYSYIGMDSDYHLECKLELLDRLTHNDFEDDNEV